MSIYRKLGLFAACLFLIPRGLIAQTGDVCSKLPSIDSVRTVSSTTGAVATNSEVVVQQMRERAEMQARQEKDRATWTVQLVTVKYLDSAAALKALCIFPAEIIPQTGLHLISVRAPATSMAAIVEAIKRLDVPQVGPKNVEWTINVLVASDQAETLRPVSASLNAVVDQLKGLLAYKQFYLLDTMFGTTANGHSINLNGGVRGLVPPQRPGDIRDTSYVFSSNLSIGNGDSASAAVRMSQLNFRLNVDIVPVIIGTDVDIPPGKQVVVGKSTSGERAYILVVSAKILN